MKKLLLLLGLALASACSKKDTPPAYADFTPISGQFTVFDMGVFRYNGRDTTGVLANLQLRIQPFSSDQSLNEYTFRGSLSAHEILEIQLIAPQNRVSATPLTGLQVYTRGYFNGQRTNTQGNSPTTGSLSAAGNTFTASFDVSGMRGELK